MGKNQKKPLTTPEAFNRKVDTLAGYLTVLMFAWEIIKGALEWLAR